MEDSKIAQVVIRNTSKLGPMGLFRLPGIKKRFARFLEAQANPGYLRAASASPATSSSCRVGGPPQ